MVRCGSTRSWPIRDIITVFAWRDWGIFSRILVTVDGIWDWMIGFIAPYTFIQFGTTCNTALSLIYTLSSSALYTGYGSQSLLAVSLQRIYHSRTVTSTYMWSVLCTALFLSCHFFSMAFDCHLQNWTQFPRLLFYTPSRLLIVPVYKPSVRTPRQTQSACLLVRYLAVDILLLSRSCVLRECVYRLVA
jgi:hypothetical protein